MRRKTVSFSLQDQAGASSVEYGMLVALISLAAIGAAGSLGFDIRSAFQTSQSTLETSRSGQEADQVLAGFAMRADGSIVAPIAESEECAADTPGDDTYGEGRFDTPLAEKCVVFSQGGWDSLFYPDTQDALQITIDYTGGDGGEFVLGDGSDRVLYIGGDVQVSPGNGPDDVIVFQGFSSSDLSASGAFQIENRQSVSFSSGGDYILIESTFQDQGEYIGPFDTYAFDDASFDVTGFREFVLDSLTTDGSDTILASDLDDIIRPQAGDDTISAYNGDDIIIYTSGNDIINGGTPGFGHDTLDLTKYERTEVSFAVTGNNDYDVTITTPDGTISLPYYSISGDTNRSVDSIEFSNSADSMDYDAIMLAANS
jgi:pilus assembly protein Flp/PilA